MKNFKYLFIMFIAVMASVSCNKDDDEGFDDNFDDNFGDSALFGTWVLTAFEDGETFTDTVTFNENLSGTYLSNETFEGETQSVFENFTWSTNENILRCESYRKVEKASFATVGNNTKEQKRDNSDNDTYTDNTIKDDTNVT